MIIWFTQPCDTRHDKTILSAYVHSINDIFNQIFDINPISSVYILTQSECRLRCVLYLIAQQTLDFILSDNKTKIIKKKTLHSSLHLKYARIVDYVPPFTPLVSNISPVAVWK